MCRHLGAGRSGERWVKRELVFLSLTLASMEEGRAVNPTLLNPNLTLLLGQGTSTELHSLDLREAPAL